MTVFVDTSAFYAAADRSDTAHRRSAEILASGEALITSDHVLVETWILIRHRLGPVPAERFWDGLRLGAAVVEPVVAADLERAWAIGREFPDQGFSIVDRTSFALMQRIGVLRAVSFDNDFAIFRFGPGHSRAFEIVR